MVQTDRAAPVGSGFVAGDFAAEEIYGTAIDRINRTADLGTIVGNRAAVDVYSAALIGLKRTIQEDRAAIAIGFIAGNFAAVHIKDTVDVVQCDGAAATVSSMAAGNFSTVHIHRTVMKVNSCSAPAVVCAIDGAAAHAVAEDEARILPHLNLLGTVACKGLAVQAQIQRLSAWDFQVALDRDVIRQADIGGIIVTIIDGRSAVPRLICHIRMGGVVAHIGIAAADAMGVRRNISRRGDRTGDGRGFADAIFGQLDRHREAAVGAALIGIAARLCRNHITNGDLAVAVGNVNRPDLSGGPCGKRGLCVRFRHGDRKALRQRVDQLVDLRRNADMGIHVWFRCSAFGFTLLSKLLHACEINACSLVELLRICTGEIDRINEVQHRRIAAEVLCVEDCLRRQKCKCISESKARLICTHGQADVTVKRKRIHVNTVLRICAGHRHGCGLICRRVYFKPAAPSGFAQVDHAWAAANILGRTELHAAVHAEVDIALCVEQTIVVGIRHHKAIVQIEGIRTVIIVGEAVFQDICLIALTDSDAVQPNVVIGGVVNE